MKMFKALTAPAMLALVISAPSFSADYKIDPAHSSIQFKINHLGFTDTVGRFNSFEGMFSDTKGQEKAEITIHADSIDTNHKERDKHLRSPDFFNVKEHPTLVFEAKDISSNKVDGVLTMNGQTKPITLEGLEFGEGEDPWGGYRKGFTGTTIIKRSEWGISYFLPSVGDEVEIELNIEAIKI